MWLLTNTKRISFLIFQVIGYMYDKYNNMKTQVNSNKKIVNNPLPDKKPSYIQNPYNDMPTQVSPTVKTTMNKIIKLPQKNIEISKSPALKTNKIVSPDVVRTVGLSASSNNDSLQKNKVIPVDPNKNGMKKIVKVEKYNDYFDTDNQNGKGIKHLANLSKKSAESNSSAKSIQSQNKKTTIPHRDLNKVINKIQGSKPFPLTGKVAQPTSRQHKNQTPQLSNLMNINNMPNLKTGKLGDDRKSWSYSNLNTHLKTNSKELDLNKSPFFANVDFKNTRSTTGNPQNPHKSPVPITKNVNSAEKNVKSISIKKEGGKFIPSSSKSQSSQSPDKFKKTGQLNKGTIHVKSGTIQPPFSLDKKLHPSAPSAQKQQLLYTYPKVLQVGQLLTLRVVSHDTKMKYASFKVLKILSKDQKTNIYLVLESTTKFLYCLKKCQIVRDQKDNQQHLLNRLEYLIRQGKIGSIVNHPNIIKTYCTLYDGLHVYQLLEYIEGNNLYDRNKDEFCSQKSVTERDSLGVQKSSLSKFVNKMYAIKQILYQLLDALNYLHQRGIVHRDIKPANILITHDNNYKIGDFGTAIWEFSAEPIGTLDYAAPQIMLKDKYDRSIDIWAVGCIGFELYVGYPPFFNENRDITIKKITQCDYQHLLIQDQGLSSLIGKMLQKKPQKRITAAEALHHPFLSELKNVKQQL